MNRKQFMDELNRLLMDIPDNERREAIQYYNDYFDDAGEENEAKVIKELGSPQQVAQNIREGMTEGTAEYKNVSASGHDTYHWKIPGTVLLCILLSPVIIPVVIGLLAAGIGLIFGIFGILIGVIAAGAAFLIAGIATLIFGIIKMFALPALGIAVGGIGCLLFGAGILTSLFTVWCCIHMVPAMAKYILKLIQLPLRKAGIIK